MIRCSAIHGDLCCTLTLGHDGRHAAFIGTATDCNQEPTGVAFRWLDI